jgi:hypothetical protein
MDIVEHIETYVHEAELLTHVIEKSNFMIDRLEGNPELQQHYSEQLMPTIQEYRQTIQALKFLFEEYFLWEKKNSSTRNLRYRRLYRMVLKELIKPVPQV